MTGLIIIAASVALYFITPIILNVQAKKTGMRPERASVNFFVGIACAGVVIGLIIWAIES